MSTIDSTAAQLLTVSPRRRGSDYAELSTRCGGEACSSGARPTMRSGSASTPRWLSRAGRSSCCRVAAAAVPAAFPSLSAPSVAFLTQTRHTPASDRNSLANSEENAVATGPTSMAQSSTPREGATARARRHEWVKRVIRRRAGRIRVLLLVLALLLPLLITTLLGGH